MWPNDMGAMGMVVGHELTHGFDDKGSQFDAKGNLSGWWDDMTRKAFEVKTKCVEEQYGNFEALPGVKLNGKLTLGENIADAGGVKRSGRDGVNHGRDPETLEGQGEAPPRPR